MSCNDKLRTEHLAKVAAVKKQFEDRMSQLLDENVGPEILTTMHNELNTGHVSFIRSSIIKLFYDPHVLFGNHLESNVK